MVASPEISVNKLAEFVVSKSAKQRAILKARKYPSEDFVMGTYHREAAEAVSKYLADGAIDPTPLNTQVNILSQVSSDKVGTMRRVAANIDALERFQSMLDLIDLKGASASLGKHKNANLTIHGVKISVRPEIILSGTAPKSRQYIGGVKLHFSKTTNMTNDMAGYVSAMVQEYCAINLAGDAGIINSEYCQVFDVGTGVVFQGVKSVKQRIKDIEAACQNIGALWPSI